MSGGVFSNAERRRIEMVNSMIELQINSISLQTSL